MEQTLIQAIASTVTARANCAAAMADQPIDHPKREWYARHTAQLQTIGRDRLPSGSGIDCGTAIDLDASRPNRIVLTLSYHHMAESGMYDGWTDHTVIVTPDLLSGFTLRITGRDRNSIKEYLYQVYDTVLHEQA
jgi:hypothetical protein